MELSGVIGKIPKIEKLPSQDLNFAIYAAIYHQKISSAPRTKSKA